MRFEQVEIKIIKGAYRELLLGIELSRFGAPASFSEVEAKHIDEMVRNITANEEVNFSCNEIKVLRNMLSDLMRELNIYEFSTRMGYSLSEVFVLFIKVKESVDTICIDLPNQNS